ncbi:AAA family ATPase [Kribbella sp. NPDC059898]|uniref:AAA family ATPase n=1 Tax=Kribbella sp. NPDC059898 TaxID=3346995 RepID=UPI00365AF5F9
MALIYVTGSSGVGKTAVGDELRRRGYVVYDADRDRLARWFDARGAEVAMPAERDDAWFADHTYRLPPETLRDLAHEDALTFVCGTVGNDDEIWDLFDTVISLSLDVETLARRLTARGGFGSSAAELHRVLGWHEDADNARYGALLVDASGAVREVADRLLGVLDGRMTWEESDLPRGIVALLAEPHTLTELAEALDVTDARVLWYLERLRDTGRVVEDAGRWRRTAAGAALAASPAPEPRNRSAIPGASAQDYVQAYADAAAGMYAAGFVQDSGEHAGRVPGERVVEFHERLLSLVNEYFAPDKIDRAASPKYGFRWVLTPVDLHPLDD